MMRTLKTVRLFTGLFVIVLGLWACQSSGLSGKEQTVNPERRIPIADGGPHDGRTEAGSTKIVYQYTRLRSSTPEGNLAIKGKVVSAPAETVTLNVYLLALDPNGHVLDKQVMYASGHNNFYAVGNWVFDASLEIPPGTAAMAFDAYTQQSRGRR